MRNVYYPSPITHYASLVLKYTTQQDNDNASTGASTQMNMLRSIRERKGLTVGQLAARASIPSRVLTEYEEGRQPIPLPHAKLLAKALWVQMEDLLPAAGTAPPPPNPTATPPAPAVAHT